MIDSGRIKKYTERRSKMLVYVSRINLNDNDQTIKFIEAEVVFHDDEKVPHKGADIAVFLAKNDQMTIAEVKAAAVQKARDFLSFAATLSPSEYHRQLSFESVPEEAF
jgi:hypothetical protein